jgi:hypothetical protein
VLVKSYSCSDNVTDMLQIEALHHVVSQSMGYNLTTQPSSDYLVSYSLTCAPPYLQHCADLMHPTFNPVSYPMLAQHVADPLFLARFVMQNAAGAPHQPVTRSTANPKCLPTLQQLCGLA